MVAWFAKRMVIHIPTTRRNPTGSPISRPSVICSLSNERKRTNERAHERRRKRLRRWNGAGFFFPLFRAGLIGESNSAGHECIEWPRARLFFLFHLSCISHKRISSSSPSLLLSHTLVGIYVVCLWWCRRHRHRRRLTLLCRFSLAFVVTKFTEICFVHLK